MAFQLPIFRSFVSLKSFFKVSISNSFDYFYGNLNLFLSNINIFLNIWYELHDNLNLFVCYTCFERFLPISNNFDQFQWHLLFILNFEDTSTIFAQFQTVLIRVDLYDILNGSQGKFRKFFNTLHKFYDNLNFFCWIFNNFLTDSNDFCDFYRTLKPF